MAAGHDALEFVQPIATTAKGYVSETELGHVTIVVDRVARALLGAAIAGPPGSTEAIHEAVLAVKSTTPLAVLADTIHAFPTTARVDGHASSAQAEAARLDAGGQARAELAACGWAARPPGPLLGGDDAHLHHRGGMARRGRRTRTSGARLASAPAVTTWAPADGGVRGLPRRRALGPLLGRRTLARLGVARRRARPGAAAASSGGPDRLDVFATGLRRSHLASLVGRGSGSPGSTSARSGIAPREGDRRRAAPAPQPAGRVSGGLPVGSPSAVRRPDLDAQGDEVEPGVGPAAHRGPRPGE